MSAPWALIPQGQAAHRRCNHVPPVPHETRKMASKIIGFPIRIMLALCAGLSLHASAQEARVRDDFDDIAPWKLVVSNQVSGSLRPVSVLLPENRRSTRW